MPEVQKTNKQTSRLNLYQVVNDFDVDEEEVAIQDREFNLEKIEKRVWRRKIVEMYHEVKVKRVEVAV